MKKLVILLILVCILFTIAESKDKWIKEKDVINFVANLTKLKKNKDEAALGKEINRWNNDFAGKKFKLEGKVYEIMLVKRGNDKNFKISVLIGVQWKSGSPFGGQLRLAGKSIKFWLSKDIKSQITLIGECKAYSKNLISRGSIRCFNWALEEEEEKEEEKEHKMEQKLEEIETCKACEDGAVKCKICRGSGEKKCWNCKGGGKIKCSYCQGKGRKEIWTRTRTTYRCCPKCGKGRSSSGRGTGVQSCKNCSGTGVKECTSCKGEGEKKCRKCPKE